MAQSSQELCLHIEEQIEERDGAQAMTVAQMRNPMSPRKHGGASTDYETEKAV